MKLLKVIGLVFLIFKASLGMSMPIFASFDSNCCSELTVSSDCSSDSDEEEKGCCSSNACDCLCCGHIFTISKPHSLDEQKPKTPSTSSFTFQFIYTHYALLGIWQPPRTI